MQAADSQSNKAVENQSTEQIKSRLIKRGILAPTFRLFADTTRDQEKLSLANIALELSELEGIFGLFGRYLGTRVDLFALEDCSSLFSSLSSGPSTERDIESHFGTERRCLESQDRTKVIVVRPTKTLQSELDQLRMLKRAIQSFLAESVQFEDVINDFRDELRRSQNFESTVSHLNAIGQNANANASLFPPKIISYSQSDNELIIEQPPGIRLDHYLDQAAPKTDPFFDGMESRAGYVPEELARAICDGWLHLVFNCGIVPVDFDERDIVIVSAKQVSFVGGTFKELPQAIRDNLRRYLVHSCNDDPAKALQHLQRECDTSRCSNLNDLDRLFRQLVPFRHGGWNDEGSVNSCAETVFAQIRLLTQQGIHLNPAAREVFRGMYCLARIARQLSPVRDSLNEGIKDLRLQGLLENAREILDPIHWTAQTDKMIGLMMLAPKNFDQAIDRFGAESQPEQGMEPQHESKWSERVLLVLIGLTGIYCGIPVLSQVLAKFQRAFDQLCGWFG